MDEVEALASSQQMGRKSDWPVRHCSSLCLSQSFSQSVHCLSLSFTAVLQAQREIVEKVFLTKTREQVQHTHAHTPPSPVSLALSGPSQDSRGVVAGVCVCSGAS